MGVESMNKNLAGRLTPHIVSKIWGGERLAQIRGLDQYKDQKVGETWDVSLLSEGPSLYNGRALSEFLNESELPYLVKTIDTSEELSVQVHPGDEYARLHERAMGKTECWLVLDAGKDAGIYLGFKPGVSEHSFFKTLEGGQDISGLLNYYPVKGGEFFFVPAGSVHAIGKNVTLAEVQQSSGITYRVWDWNRVDEKGVGRELHVKKARDVLNFDPASNHQDFFKYRQGLLAAPYGVHLLVNHPQFELSLVHLQAGESLKLTQHQGRALSMLKIRGEGPHYQFGQVQGVVEQRDGFLFNSADKKTPLELSAKGDCLFLVIR